MKKILVCVFISCALAQAAYKDLGTFGNTYDIVEKDLLDEMNKAAAKIDTNKLRYKVLESVKASLQGELNLPYCKENNIREKDISAIAQYDIDIPEGDIFIPKGTKASDMVSKKLKNASISYYIINLDAKEEIEHSKTKGLPSMVLVANGDMRDERLSHFKERYIISDTLAKQLDIRCTPSIIKVSKDTLSITEIKLKRKEKK